MLRNLHMDHHSQHHHCRGHHHHCRILYRVEQKQVPVTTAQDCHHMTFVT